MTSRSARSSRIKGQVRRGQLVTTYGVGAMVAMENESFIVMGLNRWVVGEPDCREPRLERLLGVRGFVLPPASEEREDVPVGRFPQWHYCPDCRRLDLHHRLSAPDQNECGRCETALVPSRFVIACDHGHLDDFPYHLWVHEGRSPATLPGAHELEITALGETASLADIVITCTCGASRSMEGAFKSDSLKGITSCTGSRPWLGDRESCSKTPRVLQRGASNVWFQISRSALSIPPWSEAAYRVLNRHWAVLRVCPEEAVRAYVEAEQLAGPGSGFSVEDLLDAWRQRKTGEEGSGDDRRPLRKEEFEALKRGRDEDSRAQDFVSVPAETRPQDAGGLFARIMEVRRLREVRALTGFTRVMPSVGGDDEKVASLASPEVDWLPAIEVRGEGVFLELDPAKLAAWERRPQVIQRAVKLDERYRSSFMAVQREPDRQVTPRLLLAHALAHVLIDQWSLDCGYPAAALRERLYVDEEMCGLLIYTATGDSAGSLGGVIAQSDADRFFPSLREAAARFAWCANDPLCIESEYTGVDNLNLAACHACMLLPEVSCEEGNTLLDRAMLIGTPECPEIGFLRELTER